MRRGEMMQVVSNLIMNSIYGMQAGGILAISVEGAIEPRNGIILTIQDDGVGIAEEDLPRVFEAFFTTRSNCGHGHRLVRRKAVCRWPWGAYRD